MFFPNLLEDVSGNLLADERIFSPEEKAFLTDLLQRIHSQSDSNAAEHAIAQAVGEIVSERMAKALGTSVVEGLLREQKKAPDTWHGVDGPKPPGPLPPSPPGPKSLLVSDGPKPPGPLPPAPPGPKAPFGDGPKPPGPLPPGPPGPHVQSSVYRAVAPEHADSLPARCVTLPEFLAPQELDAILRYSLHHEADFRVSEVVSPGAPGGSVDYERRRSRVLMDLGEHQGVLLERIKLAWPLILKQLQHANFSISATEAQITASNDGDFFHWHSDNGHPEIQEREITFVYFFHREPKQFSGGELRIYDSLWKDSSYIPSDRFRTIVPEQNTLILFESSLTHEITPVNCPSRAFADSRFTVNGWFRR